MSKRYPNPLDRTTEKSYDIRNNVRESEKNERKIEAEKSGGNLEKGEKIWGKNRGRACIGEILARKPNGLHKSCA